MCTRRTREEVEHCAYCATDGAAICSVFSAVDLHCSTTLNKLVNEDQFAQLVIEQQQVIEHAVTTQCEFKFLIP